MTLTSASKASLQMILLAIPDPVMFETESIKPDTTSQTSTGTVSWILSFMFITPIIIFCSIITWSIPSWRKGRGPLESNILSAALCLSVTVRGELAASPRRVMYCLLASQHPEEMLPSTGVTRGHRLRPSWSWYKHCHNLSDQEWNTYNNFFTNYVTELVIWSDWNSLFVKEVLFFCS